MAIQVSARIVGKDALNLALSQLPKALGKSAVRSALKKASKPVVETARQKAKEFSESGSKSIKARTNRKLKPVGISIGPDTKHWWMWIAEIGRGSFRISPKKGEALRFVINGEEIFVRGDINIPAMSAMPFLRPAWDMHKDDVLEAFGDEMWDAIQKRARTIRRKAVAGTLGKRTTEFIRGF